MGTPGTIRQKRNERRERLQSALNSIVGQLQNMGALKIILFGSLARDEIDVTSDVDLLVLMPSDRSGKEWMSLVYGAVSRKIAADILVFTEEELKGGRYCLALFHCRQSAEKTLKAFLYSRTAAFEVLYTHSVDDPVEAEAAVGLARRATGLVTAKVPLS